MKIIDNVLLVLIAGILSSTYAQSVIDVFVKALCVKNGIPNVSEDRYIDTEMLHICLNPVTSEIIEKFSQSNGEMDSVLTVYCDNLEMIVNCLKSFLASSDSCFIEPGQNNDMDTKMNVIASKLQFPCVNRMLTNEVFRSPHLLKCSQYLPTVVSDCMTETDHELHTMISIHSMTSEKCSRVQKFQECGVKAFGIKDKCEDEVFGKMLDSMFKYINNDIPCPNLPRTPKSNSEALSASVVNVLLLFYAVIIMSLYSA